VDGEEGLGNEVLWLQTITGRSGAKLTIVLCPLCDFSLSDDEVNVVASNLAVMRFPRDVYTEIRDHIASHLERLALLSLPEKEDVEVESSTKQVSNLTLEEESMMSSWQSLYYFTIPQKAYQSPWRACRRSQRAGPRF
jgi:hypothetical protein